MTATRIADPSSNRDTVVLVGFMGAGKSAVGAALAARLDMPFVDCDALIEGENGPIPEIFAERGEAGFRTLERDVVMRVLAHARAVPAVVALGGGAVLDSDVRESLRHIRHVVWLTAPVETLWHRVRSVGAATRPLARDQAAFRRLYQERAALYAGVARITVPNDGRQSVAGLVDDLLARLSTEHAAEGARE